jgi:hypothetical protein
MRARDIAAELRAFDRKPQQLRPMRVQDMWVRVAVVQKGIDGTAARQSKQQSKSKPATVTAKRHKTVGKLLFFVQQAE